jgi:MYXO-CTERM domain-containing protein
VAGLAGTRGTYDKKGLRAEDSRKGCGCRAGGDAGGALALALGAGLLATRRRRARS